MNLKKVRLELNISDIQQILSIALDEDKARHWHISRGSWLNRWKKPYSHIEYRYSRSVTAPVRWIALNNKAYSNGHETIKTRRKIIKLNRTRILQFNTDNIVILRSKNLDNLCSSVSQKAKKYFRFILFREEINWVTQPLQINRRLF